MKVSKVAFVVLTVSGLINHYHGTKDNRRSGAKAYIQGTYMCISVTVSGGVFTITGSSYADIKSVNGLYFPLYNGRMNFYLCAGAQASLNIN